MQWCYICIIYSTIIEFFLLQGGFHDDHCLNGRVEGASSIISLICQCHFFQHLMYKNEVKSTGLTKSNHSSCFDKKLMMLSLWLKRLFYITIEQNVIQDLFGLRGERGKAEESRVELAENRLILDQINSIPPLSSLIQMDQLSFWQKMLECVVACHFLKSMVFSVGWSFKIFVVLFQI